MSQGNQVEPVASDPFAGDLFTGGAQTGGRTGADWRAPADQDAPPAVAPWHARLPQVTATEARASAALCALPAALTGEATAALAAVIAGQIGVPAEEVSVVPFDLREGEIRDLDPVGDEGPRVFVQLRAEPTGAPLAAVLDAAFAAALVDLALGGDGVRPETLRLLSTAERAVIEFLALAAVRELNGRVGDPLIRLERVSAEVPSWLAHGEGRVVAASAQVVVAGAAGFGRLYLSAEAVAALRTAGRRPAGRARDPEGHLSRRAALVARVVPELRLWLVIGRTEVAAGDLARLECGDVVVVAEPGAVWAGGRLARGLRVRVGDGEQAVITGTAREGASGSVQLRIETAGGGHSPAAEGRMKMLEEAAEGNPPGHPGQSTDLLDGLLLTVHVEIAARRMGVEELARLHAGQILDLGCRATDPVDLTVDGRRVARGELVDIEGQLGVRITQTP